MTTENVPSSPLLVRSEFIPFDAISPEQVGPTIARLIRVAEDELSAIKRAATPRTFQNTLTALDDLGVTLDYAMGVIGHVENVASTPQWREAYNSVLPIVTEFRSKVTLDGELWSVLKSYGDSAEAKKLVDAKARYLKRTLDSFRRNGAELPREKKEELAAISTELSKLTNQFAQNTLDATAQFEWTTQSESDLQGLPESARAMGKASAGSKGKDGWRFTLQAPSFIAIMTYLDSREKREEFYKAFNSRCTAEPFDNVGLIHQILELRAKKAEMLGFDNFADLVLQDRMAGSGTRAQQFVDELREKVSPFFKREQTELIAFVRDRFGEEVLPLQPWDIAYYAEKMRLALYDFDEESLRPYFELPAVMKGLFTLVEKIFGVSVKEESQRATWDPSVTVFSAYDAQTNELMGHFYADFSPRENKRSGAWMDTFNAGITDGRDPLPHVGLIAGNFTPGHDGNPPLLSHDEVNTLFHEFGHLLHLLCSQAELRGQTMNGVAWDFIELPSQIMENWCWEREALDLFARHHKTGELIPDELFLKLVKARNFRSGSFLMRQVGLSSIDLALHTKYDRQRDGDLIEYCRKIMQEHSSITLPPYFSLITTFTHLFSSPVAYACGYYSYQWAEVLDADSFSRFKQEGIMNGETGLAFRRSVLSKGDTDAPEQLFREFMGRDPDVNALLERSGLH